MKNLPIANTSPVSAMDQHRTFKQIPPRQITYFLLFILPVAVALTLLILPKPQFKSYDFEAGEIAKETIKAPLDIEIEDRATTEQKKQEALRQVPPVYDYDAQLLEKKIQQVNTLIGILDAEAKWLADAKTKAVSDEELAVLLEKIDSEMALKPDPDTVKKVMTFILKDEANLKLIHDVCKDIVQYVYNKLYVDDLDQVSKFSETGVSLRNMDSGELRDVAIGNDFIDKTTANEYIESKLDIFYIKSRAIKSKLQDLLWLILEPNTTLNKAATAEAKETALDRVPKVFFSKKKGEKIIGEGERLSQTQYMLLQNIYQKLQTRRVTLVDFLLRLLYIYFLLLLFFFILFYFHKWHAFSNVSHYLMLLTLFLVQALAIHALWKFFYLLSNTFDKSPFTVHEYYIYGLPFFFGTLMVSVLLNSKTAFTFGIFQLVYLPLLMDVSRFEMLYIFSGIILASILKYALSNKNFYEKAVLLMILVLWFVVIMNNLVNESYTMPVIGFHLLMVFVCGVLVYILATSLTPLFEWIFRLSTDMRLLQLLDFKHPLLEQLMYQASGTLHHSIAVANLSEVAARNIGARSILCRVASYYHDIGKVFKPEYFIENISEKENRHNKLKPSMSALILVSHVKQGQELGKRYHLPKQVMDIIQEHHGTSLIKFFYEKAKKEASAHDEASISEESYRYPGPKPRSKESAIVLLADRIEATSRVLRNPTSSRIRALVTSSIRNTYLEGQLDETHLSLRDLRIIADSFCKVLYGAFHKRIDYPNQNLGSDE